MYNYDNNKNDIIPPIKPVSEDSIEANLNNYNNITEEQINNIANNAVDSINIDNEEVNMEDVVVIGNENNGDNRFSENEFKENDNTIYDNSISLISVMDYVKYIVLFSIPFVNLFFMFKLLKSDNSNIRNLSKAYLIIFCIGIILLIIYYIFVFILLGGIR